MAKFLHNFLDLQTYPRIELDGARYYDTPAGKFKSVTTILGEKLDKSGLQAWRDAVGEEEAKKVLVQAGIRGTAVHSIAESYVLNKPDWKKGAMPSNLDSFLKLKPILDANLGSVYGIEQTLYSAKLKAAGTCDLLAGFAGYNSIVDYKTSRKLKKEEHILGYFLQATSYSIMAEELTGLQFPQIVVLISVDHEQPQIFIKRAADYHFMVFDIFN